MKRLIAIVVAVLAGVTLLGAQPGPLKKAESEAREKAEKNLQERLARHKRLERLRKDLRYVSEELDRETLVPDQDLSSYSAGGLERLRHLREKGNIDPRLNPALDKLETIYRDLPKKDYAKEYARGLVRAVARDLRWIADGDSSDDRARGDVVKPEELSAPRDEETILALLEQDLVLPDDAPDGGAKAMKLFPVDLPLEKFRKLGPIRIFLVKHRISRPKSYAATTPEAIVERKHNVQIGVEVTGTVNYAHKALDQDYCFNIGDLHIEITPEWRLSHPKIHLPKVGDKVRVKGWSYFDVFHKAEAEYNPDDPVMGATRWTQWEIHPALEVEVLP
jgi:hypothetical protein